MRYTLAIAAVVLLTTAPARAVITVSSTVTLTNGVRAQGVVSNATGLTERGDTVTAIAIKEIHSTIFLRDLGGPGGDTRRGGGGELIVTKRALSTFEAYGDADPFNRGWLVPPISDPTPPWVGLVWPYRDEYDYFGQPANPGVPLGNDVGTFFFDSPDVYQFLNVNAFARGGPTDPIVRPDGGKGGDDEDWLKRGITGNGLPVELGGNGPATYFAFDVFNNNFFEGAVFDHTVRLRIVAAEAVVVVRSIAEPFVYEEITVPIPDFEITFPEPIAPLGAGTMMSMALLKRRHRGTR